MQRFRDSGAGYKTADLLTYLSKRQKCNKRHQRLHNKTTQLIADYICAPLVDFYALFFTAATYIYLNILTNEIWILNRQCVFISQRYLPDLSLVARCSVADWPAPGMPQHSMCVDVQMMRLLQLVVVVTDVNGAGEWRNASRGWRHQLLQILTSQFNITRPRGYAPPLRHMCVCVRACVCVSII